MKKEYYGHVLLFTLVYGAMGSLAPLIGQYLKGIGFTGTQNWQCYSNWNICVYICDNLLGEYL